MRRLCFLACLIIGLLPAIASAEPTKQADDGYLPDSEGNVTVHPKPESAQPLPSYLLQAESLRRNHDPVMAATYLNSIVDRPDIDPRDRAQVILELADCLHAEGKNAESLSWLKIWMELYPGRPEVGAVAYRLGTLYTEMGLTGPARDAYYKALSSAINQGQVTSAGDLAQYSRLTSATLWALADNEYRDGRWDRAAKLFARYETEATAAPPHQLERASFLLADCLYQQRKTESATSAYELALQQHPFNPLAPSARLRLYHLYLMQKKPSLAQGELEALIWSVRAAWPKDEAYWQQQTAATLLAINQNDAEVLPKLVSKASAVQSQDKSWQMELDHYDRLAGFRASLPPTSTDVSSNPASTLPALAFVEDRDLASMRRAIDDLGPAPRSPTKP